MKLITKIKERIGYVFGILTIFPIFFIGILFMLIIGADELVNRKRWRKKTHEILSNNTDTE